MTVPTQKNGATRLSVLSSDNTLDVMSEEAFSGQLATFFELAPALLGVAGFDGYFKRVSPSWQRMLGYSAEEITALPWLDFVHPDDREATLQAGANLSNGENVLSFENRYRCKDGSYRWLHWNATSYPEQQLIFAFGRDITERKVMEEELRSNAERLRLLVEGVIDYAIFDMDVHGCVATWNASAARFKGYSADEIIGKHFSVFYPFQDINENKPERELEIARSEGKYTEEGWRVRKDGSQFFANVTITPMWDKDRQLCGYSKITRDITQHKQAEETLSKSEARLGEAQSIAKIGSWEFDLVTGEINWSQELFRLVGIAPEQGEPDYATGLTLYAPEDAARLDVCVQRAVSEGIGYELDLQQAFSEGATLHWYHAVGKPIFDAQGKVIRLAGTLMDITERKRTEEELREVTTLRQAILDSADYSIISTDTQGVILTFNHAAERVLGYSGEEVVGKVTPAIFHDADEVVARAASLTQELGRSIAPGFEVFVAKTWDGTPDENEWTYIRKDGSRFPVLLSVTALKNEAGVLTGYMGIAQDITQHKQVEETLSKSEARLGEAQSIAKSGSWEFDLVTGEITWSQELFHLAGIDPEQGEPDYATNLTLYEPKDAARLDGYVQRAMSEGIGYELDLQQAFSEGATLRWYHAVGKPVVDSQGKVIRLVGTLMDITERKQNEEVLQVAIERFHLATELGELGIWEYDILTNALIWDERMMMLYGHTQETFPGAYEAWSGRLHPDDKARVEAALWEAIRGGEKYEPEFRIVLPEGETRYIKASAVVLKDENNAPTRMIGLNQDITEKKTSEELLRLQTEHLREQASLLELAHDAILVRDMHNAITFWNTGAEQTYGWTKEEARGQRTHSFLQTQFPIPLEQINQRLAEQGSWEGELTHTRHDGEQVVVESRHALLRDEQGEPVAIMEINRDITERKHAKQVLLRAHDELEERVHLRNAELYDSEARYRFLAESMPQIVWTSRPDGNLDYYNQRWFDYTGLTQEETWGWGWKPVIHPDDLQHCIDRWTHAFTTGELYEVEYRFKRASDGVYRWHLGRALPHRDAAGEITQWAGTCTDIEDYKQAQVALQRMNNELEERVNKRTAELARSNRELDDFAYAASHDLKAPLRVIDNTSKWLEEDLEEHLNDETRENMGLLRGRVKRMEKLLDDMLEYSRIGRTIEDQDAEIIAGDVLVENILALLSPPERFRVEVSPDFAAIQVCSMPLQQILMNLISNAIKHHDKKTGCIEVTVEDRGTLYAFAVKDDGPGIPAQFHEQIFKMFQTLKPRDQVEGSGMGLAMVHKHIEVYGGKLALESSEGKGSTFSFTWPKQQQSKGEER